MLIGVWHALVGSFWERELAKELDTYLLIVFAVVFLLIQMGLVIWLYLAYNKIRKLNKEELNFKRNYKNSQLENKKINYSI
jgi:hypothetical protein